LEIKCETLTLNGSIFSSIEINEISIPNCLPNYYIFENEPSYLPIPNGKAEATCLLNNDNVTASWNITKLCEPSCFIRPCDNNQTCGIPHDELILRCICAGYVGKYCETIDVKGFFFIFFNNTINTYINQELNNKLKKRM